MNLPSLIQPTLGWCKPDELMSNTHEVKKKKEKQVKIPKKDTSMNFNFIFY